VHVVVNHLHLHAPMPHEIIEKAQEGCAARRGGRWPCRRTLADAWIHLNDPVLAGLD